MGEFLDRTLAGLHPQLSEGNEATFRWQWRGEGILQIIPHKPATRALVLSAGIHGNETAPVEMLDELLTALFNGQWHPVWQLLFVLGNPGALRAGTRYLDNDLNRMFGGRYSAFPPGPETRRAVELEAATRQFYHYCGDVPGWHLDLHTAIRGSRYPRFGVLPARNTPWDVAFLDWLGVAGLAALVFHQSPGGTYTHYTAEHFNALSCTFELGKALPFGQNDLRDFAITQTALQHLLSCYDGEVAAPVSQPDYFQVCRQLTREGDDFVLHIPEDTLNFTAFTQGTLLTSAGEQHVRVQHPQEYVLFPNPRVAKGLRAGLMLIPVNPV